MGKIRCGPSALFLCGALCLAVAAPVLNACAQKCIEASKKTPDSHLHDDVGQDCGGTFWETAVDGYCEDDTTVSTTCTTEGLTTVVTIYEYTCTDDPESTGCIHTATGESDNQTKVQCSAS